MGRNFLGDGNMGNEVFERQGLIKTGMELAIPLANFQGIDELNILVSLVDGGGSTGIRPEPAPARIS